MVSEVNETGATNIEATLGVNDEAANDSTASTTSQQQLPSTLGKRFYSDTVPTAVSDVTDKRQCLCELDNASKAFAHTGNRVAQSSDDGEHPAVGRAGNQVGSAATLTMRSHGHITFDGSDDKEPTGKGSPVDSTNSSTTTTVFGDQNASSRALWTSTPFRSTGQRTSGQTLQNGSASTTPSSVSRANSSDNRHEHVESAKTISPQSQLPSSPGTPTGRTNNHIPPDHSTPVCSTTSQSCSTMVGRVCRNKDVIRKLNGEHVHVTGSCGKAEGTISIAQRGAPRIVEQTTREYMTCSEFAALAGPGSARSIYDRIVLSRSGETLLDIAGKEDIQLQHHYRRLAEDQGLETVEMDELAAKLSDANRNNAQRILSASNASPKRAAPIVYRVLSVEDSHKLDEILKNGIDRRCPSTDVGISSPTEYLVRLQAHVNSGTKSSTTSWFISTTKDMQTALWWSHYGLLPIVQIDLDKVGNSPWYDISSDDSIVRSILNQKQQRFADASSELLIDRYVPAEALSRVEIELDRPTETSAVIPPVQAMMSPRGGNSKKAQLVDGRKQTYFPKSLTSKDKGWRFNTLAQFSNSTTKPLLIEDQSTGKKFICKRGGHQKGGYSTIHSHAKDELLASAVYRAFSVPCPACMCYKVMCQVSGQKFPIWMLLREYIPSEDIQLFQEGDKYLKDDAREGLFVDLLVNNTDATGASFQNLWVVNQRVVRSDLGACMGRNPNGQIARAFFPDDASIKKLLDTVRGGQPQCKNPWERLMAGGSIERYLAKV
eukprot:gb/GECG01012541.1/.p1 GENE.gb/GECG01012541.1/~~gb/GECG01012541.1/.p1  ORF type:complete len:773 (+),score=80.91 gb/GECG01012541.1/:1-2319(+)